MSVNYFRRIDCPFCKDVDADFIRPISMVFRVRKFDVDDRPLGAEVKRWKDVTGKTPAIEVNNEQGGVDWYIEYDGIKSFSDRIEELAEKEKYPAMGPVAVEVL